MYPKHAGADGRAGIRGGRSGSFLREVGVCGDAGRGCNQVLVGSRTRGKIVTTTARCRAEDCFRAVYQLCSPISPFRWRCPMFDGLFKNTLAPLVLRLALAAIFIYHGLDKVINYNWGTEWMQELRWQQMR